MNYIDPKKLSIITGYSTNAIRQKRLKNQWITLGISLKNGYNVKIDIEKFNLWCISKNRTAQIEISTDKIQFMKLSKFTEIYGLSETQLSRFCDFTNINFNSLVICAPDGKKLINIVCYQNNLLNILKFFNII